MQTPKRDSFATQVFGFCAVLAFWMLLAWSFLTPASDRLAAAVGGV